MYQAFPGSDYYWASVTIGVAPVRQSRVPSTVDVSGWFRCPFRVLKVAIGYPASLECVHNPRPPDCDLVVPQRTAPLPGSPWMFPANSSVFPLALPVSDLSLGCGVCHCPLGSGKPRAGLSEPTSPCRVHRRGGEVNRHIQTP